MSNTQGPVRKGLDWAQARVLDTPPDPETEWYYRFVEKAE